MQRTIRSQLRDAGRELAVAFGPPLTYGFVAGVIGLLVGSLIFENVYVTAYLAIVVFLATAVPIAGQRLNRLARLVDD